MRRQRQPDLPLGTMQLCLPMRSEPVASEAFGGDGTAQVAALFGRFAHYLAAAYGDLGLQAAYTPEHCRKLERLLLHMQPQIRAAIAASFDQSILLRLRSLHRLLAEACVVVRSVCGLCAEGRHLAEPTGAFWQLVEYVRKLRQDCQLIARRAFPVSVPTQAQASA
jgi:hypothetical protein